MFVVSLSSAIELGNMYDEGPWTVPCGTHTIVENDPIMMNKELHISMLSIYNTLSSPLKPLVIWPRGKYVRYISNEYTAITIMCWTDHKASSSVSQPHHHVHEAFK